MWLIYTTGTVVCKGNKSDSNQPLPTVLEAIELVAACLLEPVPITESEPVSVHRKLHEHSSFWMEKLEESSFFRDIISHGYRIPFVELPWPVFKVNHCSALEHQEFVLRAIQELLDTNCVALCEECPTLCSPLSVVENSRGKLRLVLDSSSINSH